MIFHFKGYELYQAELKYILKSSNKKFYWHAFSIGHHNCDNIMLPHRYRVTAE